MAGELIPQQQSSLGSTLTGAANLANLFLPQNTNQTGSQTIQDNRSSTSTQTGGTTTTTTSTNTDPKAVQAVVDSILQGTNGLAAVSSGQRSAGLYGSSTNQLLTNDLIARTAAEAAKLNQSTTQTTVRPDQTTTTVNSGGQTTTSNQATNKQAPVSGGMLKGAAGVIGALQLLPKDVKDAVVSGLGFGKKAAGAGASSLASNMKDSSASSTADYGANVAANEASLGGVGTAGLDGQTVAGISPSFTDQYLGSSAGSSVDLSASGSDTQDVGYSLSGSGNADASGAGDFGDFSGVGDSITQGLGDTADALGGFLSGVGDTVGNTAADIGSSIGDWFDDFDFSFADGGAVSLDGIKGKMNEHVTKKLADGGGIGAPGDTRYGNNGNGRPMQSSGGSETIFQRTNRTREETAGSQAPAQDVMQRGFIPRTEQERQSVFSLIDTVPQLLNALLGNDSSAAGKADGGAISTNPKGYADGGNVGYGKREDGTEKGKGYYGEVARPDGNFSTELSAGVELDGVESLIPLMVPGLTKEQMDRLLNGNGMPTDDIIDNAVSFAMSRKNEGKGYFADKSEEGKTKLPKYANGGSVTTAEDSNVYDLSGVSYLANTGLTAKGPDLVKALGASSNDQVVNRMIQDNIRPTDQSNNVSQRAIENTSRTAGTTGGSSRTINPTVAVGDGAQSPGGAGISVGEGIGTVGGIGNAIGSAIGASPGAVNAGLSGLSAVAGIPGLGMINAIGKSQDNNAAVTNMAIAAIGMVNPVAGLIASIVSNMITPSTPTHSAPNGAGQGGSANGTGTGDDDGPVGVAEVGPVTVAEDSSVNVGIDAAAANAANNANGNGNTGPADGDGSSGGDGGSSGGGSGAGSAGSSADGSYADGSPGGITVAQARANPATTSDKIPAMLSENEYVLPADVTAAIGIPALDALVAKYHVPAAQQQRNHARN